MQRLADIELQLIMHGLDSQELLQFARCSRRTLYAADSAFAWRHTHSELAFQLRAPSRISALLQGAKRLLRTDPASSVDPFAASPSHPLRHSRFLLRLTVPVGSGFKLSSLDKLLDHLTRHANYSPLHALHTLDCENLPLDCWSRLLSHPAMRSLRVLRRQRSGSDEHPTVIMLTADFMRHLVDCMPHLHTLELDCLFRSDAGPILPQVLQLRSLHTLDPGGGWPGCRAAILQCAQLTRLSLVNPPMDLLLLPILTSPLMQQNLQWLRLEQWDFKMNMLQRGRGISAGTQEDYSEAYRHYSAAFTSMRNLNTMQLSMVAEIDLLIPLLRLPPALRSLHIHTRAHAWAERCIPSAGMISYLLKESPHLHCTLQLDDASPDRREPGPSSLAAKREQYRPLLRNQASQFSLPDPQPWSPWLARFSDADE